MMAGLEYDASGHIGFTQIDMFPQLVGRPWDAVAKAVAKTVSPTCVRITHGEVKADARSGRVTVFLDANDLVTRISMELDIELPIGYKNGSAISVALRK